MGERRKICAVVTARPSYSRVKTALESIRDHPDLDLQVVVGSSAVLDRYGNVASIIERDGFQIAARTWNVLEGEDLTAMAKTAGLAVMELATVFGNLKPDMVLTIADRFETLATSMAASYQHIPLIHLQGGEVTGSIDEKVRHANTKLADVHLVSTNQARDFVERMGENPEMVFVTGCPSIDIAHQVLESTNGTDFDPFEKYGGVGERFDLSRGYLVVMQHPVTTEYELARTQVLETLHAVKDAGIPAIWFWPNVDAGSDGTSNGIRYFRETEDTQDFHFFKNMAPDDFLRLLIKSKAIVGNSSVAIRECSYLGVPAVNIGTRQMGRERGANVLDVDYDRGAIAGAIRQHCTSPRPKKDELYGDGQAGPRIAACLAEVALTTEKRLSYEIQG